MASAAILVGGQARRFGGIDKSALGVGGRTILDYQVGVLRALTDDILIVGRAPAGRAAEGVRVVADAVAGAGPLGGLETALTAARHDPLVLLACDMPCVTTALLERLLELAPLADAVVPRTSRGYHPLCAVYSRACHRAVMRRLAAHQLAMHGLLDDVQVHTVEEDEVSRYGAVDRLLANVNTRADLHEIEMTLGHTL